MKFYNRETELELLNSIAERSKSEAQMTVVVGRRRIGKTSLLKRSEQLPTVYFFVARKSEVLLCEEFVGEIESKLNVKIIGQITQFKDLFLYLMELAKSRNFTLIIDEFQEFFSINPSVYSDMQNIWDSNKEQSKINLILCGSVYSLMKRIFENSKEPLFSRATERIHLKPFDIKTIKEILHDNYPAYTNDDLLAFYTFTGGVAKYVELFVAKKAFTLEKILDEIFRPYSLFLDEGHNVLIDEFGKDYATYFSILSLIASSKTARSDIESILGITVGGYLERLDSDFNLIKKVRPMFAKPGSRNMKYRIVDNFLSFWFRFVYKYKSAVEIGNYQYVRTIIERDYNTYSGLMLERYFTDKMSSSQLYSDIGNYWEKANQNEIDIVAINEFEKTVVFAEVKRKKENISTAELKRKSETLLGQFKGYSAEYMALSIEDM
ncbi:MAG: ATP-binding protein [Dysgonomonas sp.]|nr:ATP-binding protein [Dysgonomonas sp.]